MNTSPYGKLTEAIKKLETSGCTVCPDCRHSLVEALKALKEIVCYDKVDAYSTSHY